MRASIVVTVAIAGAFLALSGGDVAHAGAKPGGGDVPGGNRVSVPVADPIGNCDSGSVPLEVAHTGCSGGVRAAGVSWERSMTSERLASKASLERCLSSVGCEHSMAAAIVEHSTEDSVSRAFLDRCLSRVACERSMAEAVWKRSATKASWVRSMNGVSWEGSLSRVSLEHWVTGVSWEGSMLGVSWDSEMLSRTEELRIHNHISVPCQCLGRVPHVGIPLVHHPVTPRVQHAVVPHAHHVTPHTPVTTATTRPTSQNAATPIRGMLPITGVNLEGLMGSAFGLLAAGIAALFGAARAGGRRRPRGPA